MPVDRVSIHDQFHGEMKKARERILTTADGEVGWLLKFIQTDLDTLTASEWMVLAFEIASFVDDVANRRGRTSPQRLAGACDRFQEKDFVAPFPVGERPKRSRDGPGEPGKAMGHRRRRLYVPAIHDHCHAAPRRRTQRQCVCGYKAESEGI